LKEFSVNIIGLSKKSHQFEFQINDGFFAAYGNEIITRAKLEAKVTLDKRETFIEADFEVVGFVTLVCDRSLEPFQHPLKFHKKVIFKYGEEAQEISDEIVVITRDQDSLDLGQYLYEFIILEIPIKKIHPDLQEEDVEEGNLKMIYSTGSDEDNDDNNEIDPRWEKLKKLK
jgi:uncharacterized metal-binding protein YceD (DUF177 family)